MISPTHVLTARHCVVNLMTYFKVPSEYVQIRVGSNKRLAKEGVRINYSHKGVFIYIHTLSLEKYYNMYMIKPKTIL